MVQSHKFAYEKSKNLTLLALQDQFTRSMNECANPNDPRFGGWTLHMVASKADWKHKREWLQLGRHYSKTRICERCFAGSNNRPWIDAAETFNNPEEVATALATSAPLYCFSNTMCILPELLKYFYIPSV